MTAPARSPDRPSNVTVHPAVGLHKHAARPRPPTLAPTLAPMRATDPKAEAMVRQRENTRAKNAMVASVGALIFTGYLCARGSRRDTGAARLAHIAAGVAPLGASDWHTTLYGPRAGGRTGGRIGGRGGRS